MHFCPTLTPATQQCSTVRLSTVHTFSAFTSFHVSDVPELPEEVEAVEQPAPASSAAYEEATSALHERLLAATRRPLVSRTACCVELQCGETTRRSFCRRDHPRKRTTGGVPFRPTLSCSIKSNSPTRAPQANTHTRTRARTSAPRHTRAATSLVRRTRPRTTGFA